jgi:hypothetical protein
MDVNYNRCLLLEKTGNYDDAIQNFQTYLQLASASPDSNQAKETVF